MSFIQRFTLAAIAAVSVITSIPSAEAHDLRASGACAVQEFENADHPELHQLKPGQDWLCSTWLFFKGDDGDLEITFTEIVLQYHFTRNGWALTNRYDPMTRYLPYDYEGVTLKGLFSWIPASRVDMNDVIRVTKQGLLVSEWSVDLASAMDPSYSGAHTDAPTAATSYQYIDHRTGQRQSIRRVVSRMHLCTTDSATRPPCSN